MLFDMENPSGYDPYEVLVNLVIPRPIAWVSTKSSEGIFNLAPFSFYNAICDEPPVVLLSISKRETERRKDTTENILKTGDFVINLASEELIDKIELSSEDFPPEVDEFKITELTPIQAYKVKSPRVKEAKAWLECVLIRHEELFGYDLIFGKVVFAGAESFSLQALRAVGRLGKKFCKVIELSQ